MRISKINVRRLYLIAGFILIYFLFIRLGELYNIHPAGHSRSELWADKSGYYIYLPAAFIYGFHEEDYPPGIVERLGLGFQFTDGKLYTKYTMGVAVLASPFFLLKTLSALAGGRPTDGFSPDYYNMAYYSSAFYFLLGSILLFIFLRRKYSRFVSASTVLLIMFGTNLYYYTFIESLMSHVYSYFLFSLLLLLTDNLWNRCTTWHLFAAVLVAAMILLVRPSNGIFLPVILFLGIKDMKELSERLRFLFKPLNLLGSALIILLIFTPQMLYWKFLSGHFIFYTYQWETFIYWNNPKIFVVLFAPGDGLLTYSPAYLFTFLGLIVMFFRKEMDRWLITAIFLLLLYMTASWHSYRFGCNFGHRAFTDFLPLFSLPFASFFRWWIRLLYPYLAVLGVILLGYLIYVNISLAGIYDACYEGNDWEWQPYKNYFRKAEIFPFQKQKQSYNWMDDYESSHKTYGGRLNTIPFTQAYSGNYVSKVDSAGIYSDGFGCLVDHISYQSIKRVDVNFKCFYYHLPDNAQVVISVEKENKVLVYKSDVFSDEPYLKPDQWNDVHTSYQLDKLLPTGYMKVYIWMERGEEIFIDDLKVSVVFK